LEFQQPRASLVGGDAIVLSIPKSGRTWLRAFVCAYFCKRYGFEMTLEPERYGHPAIPRIIYSHDTFEQRTKAERLWDRVRGKYLIPGAELRRARVILLARDPRDAFVSLFVQTTRRVHENPDELKQKTASELLRDPAFGIRSIVDVMNGWLAELGARSNFTLFRYETLREDPAHGFREVLAALGETSPHDDAFAHALAFSDFGNMKKLEQQGAFESKILRAGDVRDPSRSSPARQSRRISRVSVDRRSAVCGRRTPRTRSAFRLQSVADTSVFTRETPLRFEAEEPLRLMEPAQDLTSQTPAERWGELNRAILESALDCIITMDADGLVREFNPAAERVFGYRREDAVGQELANLIVPPALRERHRQGLAHYLKSGEGPVLGRRIEIAAVRADGTEILVELAITPLRISGRPMFTAYLRDITERVRSERRRTAQYSVASLLASSLSLREVGPQILQTIATSGDWVFGSIWAKREADAGLKCVATWRSEADGLEAFEKVTREMSLVGSSGLPGRVYASEEPLWIADVTTDPQFVRTEAARSANLHGAFAFPLCGESAASGVLELFSHSTVIPDEDLLQLVEALGSQIGLFVQRRQIQKELERQKEAAEAANAAKDQFLANLSHELRTPLTPVLIWAGAMAGDDTLPKTSGRDFRWSAGTSSWKLGSSMTCST
jgi:PAS domain S-box-containing protein